MSEAGLRGTLVSGIGSFYTVLTPEGARYTVRAKKKFRHRKLTPLVGDEVIFLPGEGEEDGWLEDILDRKTVCIRPPVANISLLMLVLCPEPAPDLMLMDRLMVQARRQGMKLCMLVTKSDLDATLAEKLQREYAQSDMPVIPVSVKTGEGLAEVRQAMRGETACLAGQSGAGKSTLLNTLFSLSLETGDISEKIRRGKNTTRKAELFSVEDGQIRVLDTAGFSLLEMEDVMDPTQLRLFYPEFAPYEGTCRFAECLHDREPGCAVQSAVEAGSLSEARVARYRQLLGEVREVWRDRYD
ncbi:MAG: ribosome small subunit-dependent GTPase A [Clostridia bacterium]|nr:ribosome small subunit-dependent GTPase A [Clostridia bacterium]